MKKIVLKVFIMCEKCKTSIMSTVAKLSGVKSLVLDDEKGTLTVVGEVDVVLIVKKLKKAKRIVSVDSVGPPDNKKKEEEEKKKKEEEEKKKKEEVKKLPQCCATCRPPVILLYEDASMCSIL